MSKRVRLTVTMEYEPNPDDYPACNTVEECAQFDLESYQDDPGLIVEALGFYEHELTVEVVDEEVTR